MQKIKDGCQILTMEETATNPYSSDELSVLHGSPVIEQISDA
jgi:hypothetical protein